MCNSERLYMYHKRVCKGQKRSLHTLKLKMVISYAIDVRTQTQGPLPVQQVLLTTKLPLQPFSLLLFLWLATIVSALRLWVPTLPFLPKLRFHLFMYYSTIFWILGIWLLIFFSQGINNFSCQFMKSPAI